MSKRGSSEPRLFGTELKHRRIEALRNRGINEFEFFRIAALLESRHCELFDCNYIFRREVLLFFFFFPVNYVEERPWRPMQSPNNGRKEKAKG